MRVLLGPRSTPEDGSAEAGVARALAAQGGSIVSLQEAGVRDLSRPLTQAEVAGLREALVGREVFRSRSWARGSAEGPEGPPHLGYVCGGVCTERSPGGSAADASALTDLVVAVADHVNLTWRSPLAGRNDDSVGPRFPSMTRIYAPEMVQGRLCAEHGIIVKPGVVAGVGQDERLEVFETDRVRVGGYLAVSSELVPVAIVAAHMGLRIAAAVVTRGRFPEEEMSSGRS